MGLEFFRVCEGLDVLRAVEFGAKTLVLLWIRGREGRFLWLRRTLASSAQSDDTDKRVTQTDGSKATRPRMLHSFESSG